MTGPGGSVASTSYADANGATSRKRSGVVNSAAAIAMTIAAIAFARLTRGSHWLMASPASTDNPSATAIPNRAGALSQVRTGTE
jgi:hypothetical protein